MKHILVLIGSSENAVNTLQYAIDMASKIEANIFVFRAYNVVSRAGTIINVEEIVSRETQEYVKSIVDQVDVKDVDVKIISAKGSTASSISIIEKELGVDLVVVGNKSNSIKEEVFLGSTSGSIVKNTNIPVLVVPEGYTFKPFSIALMAFKSGKIENKEMMKPLYEIVNSFQTKVNLLLVKTPDHTEEDSVIDDSLTVIQNKFTTTENMTIFQGVLEHFQLNNPDLLCVFRRKRGFFQKLWEKNSILKSEFHCTIPMLILSSQ